MTAFVLESCDRFSSCSPLFPYTAQCLVLSGTCYTSVYGVVFYVKRWITDPEVDLDSQVLWSDIISTAPLYLAAFSSARRPQSTQCGIFWETPSRNVPIFSAFWFDCGYLLRQFTEAFGSFHTGCTWRWTRTLRSVLSARSHLPSPMRTWPRSSSTSVVWPVLLVMMHFALCFLLLFSGPDARHHGRYEPEGFLRVFIPAVACARLVFLVHACGMFPSFLAGS